MSAEKAIASVAQNGLAGCPATADKMCATLDRGTATQTLRMAGSGVTAPYPVRQPLRRRAKTDEGRRESALGSDMSCICLAGPVRR